MSMKYQKLCDDVLSVVKRENIQDVFCCATRLRLIVKDKSAVDVDKLKSIKGVLEVREVGNQLQLVIGTHVQDVYRDFCEITGFKEQDVIGDDDEIPSKATRGFSFGRVMEILSSVFSPLLPIFSTGGMIKCLLIVLTTFFGLDKNGGTYAVLNAIGDAPFYFLPFAAGCTAAKCFNLNQLFGVLVAGCLMYPTFADQVMGESVPFLFFSIPSLDYSTSVIPVILSVYVIARVYRFVDSFVPSNWKLMLSGSITFILVMPIALAVIAPIGNFCGEALSSVLMQALEMFGPFAGAVLAGAMSFLVMTGMHVATFGIILDNLNTVGYDFIIPAMLVNNVAVAAATIAVSFKMRRGEMSAAAFSTGMMGFMGITEPALYSVDFKYRQALIGIVLGGAVGGAIYMLFGVKCFAFVTLSLFGLPAFIDGGSNLLFTIVAVIATAAVSFGYSFLTTKNAEDIEIEAA